MADGIFYRRGSVVGALLLIAIGVLFLYANLRPGFDPWPLLARYWPLLLILWGAGKLVDYVMLRGRPEGAAAAGLTGGGICLLIFLLLVGAALSGAARRDSWWRKGTRGDFHHSEVVERRGAESVDVRIKMRGGALRLAGGAAKLLEADFGYNVAEWKPEVSYDVSKGRGELQVEQPDVGVHWGQTRNVWDLRLSNEVPIELRLQMGAGQGDVRLGSLALSKLDIAMGAGELTLDLTGDWKNDLEAGIHGGVGSLTVRLPRDVCTRVRAKGGLGAINADGLKLQGETYTNDACGESKVTLRLNIVGGIGEINLQT